MEVAPAVFREVGGDKTVAFIQNDAGQVVGMVGQFAFIPGVDQIRRGLRCMRAEAHVQWAFLEEGKTSGGGVELHG